MPRRRFYADRDTVAAHREDLVQKLAHELKHPQEAGQPLILEQKLAHTQGLQVYVVWDEFDERSDEDRTNAILDAFELAEGREQREQIVVAHGLTVPEAADMGWLPTRVVWSPMLMEPAVKEKFAEAVRAEGASWLRKELAPELRFRDDSDALTAIERLERKLPDNFRFILVHDPVPR